MTVRTQSRRISRDDYDYLNRPAPARLVDVAETVMDRGLLVDVFICVSPLDLDLVTIDAHFVVSSIATYLRWADAVNCVELASQS